MDDVAHAGGVDAHEGRLPLWAAVPLGAAAIAAAAQLVIPMSPVPMTMQTYAVLVVGGLGGSRVGAAAGMCYLVAAALGAPVLADGEGGMAALTGATAGYLLAFPVSAAFVGKIVHDRAGRPGLVKSFGAMIGGHAITLVLGTTWLASAIGLGEAVAGGLAPFIPGAVIKSALAVATLELIRRRGWG